MSPRTRYAAAGLLAVGPFAWPFVASPFASNGDPAIDPDVLVSFTDEEIDESSGLVVRDDRLFTVNDSGDGPYVYEVDLSTGDTVGVTTYAEDEPEDVEALAPGADGSVWVGDIGDNRRSRGLLELFRVRVPPGGGRVAAERYTLRYPDRPHDAEALLVHPRTGRVLVVTKQLGLAGAVYQAPERLVAGETHVLERVAAAPPVVTDGTFLGRGDRLLLRTYGRAVVYTYPAFEPVVDFDLPEQEQGEAVAEGDDGRVYLTSEGEGSDVLVVDVPEPEAQPSAQPSAAPTAEATTADRHREAQRNPQPWMGLGPTGLLLAAAGAGAGLVLVRVLLRAALRRGRRRR